MKNTNCEVNKKVDDKKNEETPSGDGVFWEYFLIGPQLDSKSPSPQFHQTQ
jgi:hypothetical protein